MQEYGTLKDLSCPLSEKGQKSTSLPFGLPSAAVLAGPGWHQHVPKEWKRLAAKREGSPEYLFTPSAEDLMRESARGWLARELFWYRWRAGEPIIIRGCKVGCVMFGY